MVGKNLNSAKKLWCPIVLVLPWLTKIGFFHNEYVYLKPKYRTSIASKYLLLQTFDYCSQLNIDVVGYTYNHSSNIHNNKLLGSDVIGTIFKVSIDLMNKKLNKIRKVK